MELIQVLDDFLSNDEVTRNQANDYLIDQIDNNTTFFNILIQFLSEHVSQHYEKLCLILIKYIVQKNYAVIQQNFQEIMEIIKTLILNTSDKHSLKILADVVYNISHKYFDCSEQKEIFEDFTNYLVLYQVQPELFPFCIYLFMESKFDDKFYLAYQQFLEEIIPEITIIGLQYEDIEINFFSVLIFTGISRNVEENFLDTYQDHLNLICQIAENSLEMDENFFNKFWANFSKIDNQISAPLFEIACTLLPNENLTPESHDLLLRFIIKRYELISPEDLEYIISFYIQTQCEAMEIDNNASSIFCNLIKIDEEASYEILKSIFVELLTNEDEKLQYVGLYLLPSFFEVYQKASTNDISEFLPISFEAASKSEENVMKELLFLESFLGNDQLNLNDSLIIIDFLIDVIVNCIDVEIQYRALNVCKKLTKNPVFFEKMIGIHDKIQINSLAVYFSILIHFFRIDSNANMYKYEEFLTFLIDIHNEAHEKLPELVDNYEKDPDDDDNLNALYATTTIYGSSGNLILCFWVFNPIQFDQYVESAIESFFYILADDEMRDIDGDSFFGLKDIKNDFTNIIKFLKHNAFDLISDHLEDIAEGLDVEKLQHYICLNFDIENPCAATFLSELEEELTGTLDGTFCKVYQVMSTLTGIVLPSSQWIYKVSDDENNQQIHINYIKFLDMVINPKQITYDTYNMISKILLRLVKPKRIEYISENKWYASYIQQVGKLACKMVNIIKFIDTVVFTRYFDGFVNLVLVFAYLGHNNGHLFLEKRVLPFYSDNKDSTEIKMLDLFSKMIEINYINEDEVALMIEIVNEIIQSEKIYHDIEIPLFELIVNLSKIRPDISPSYIELAIEIFNGNKDDLCQVDLTACLARFLLSSFNQNSEELGEMIIPLISEILAVFPITQKNKSVLFWQEMKSFVEICKDSMASEIRTALIGCLTKYLSYQRFTNVIFSIPDDEHDLIIQLYGDLIKDYLAKFPEETFNDILDDLLPNQPYSKEFILSLYSE